MKTYLPCGNCSEMTSQEDGGRMVSRKRILCIRCYTKLEPDPRIARQHRQEIARAGGDPRIAQPS